MGGLRVVTESTGVCRIEVSGDINKYGGFSISTPTVRILGIGTRRCVLTVECNCKRVPCIGFSTKADDKWWLSVEPVHLKQLIIENCDVVLRNGNDSFTLGSYGDTKPPEIILKNATLDCPEARGDRIMIYPYAIPPMGALITSDPRYAVAGEYDDEFDDAQKEVLKTWNDIYGLDVYKDIPKPWMSPNVLDRIGVLIRTENFDADVLPKIDMLHSKFNMMEGYHPDIISLLCKYPYSELSVGTLEHLATGSYYEKFEKAVRQAGDSIADK